MYRILSINNRTKPRLKQANVRLGGCVRKGRPAIDTDCFCCSASAIVADSTGAPGEQLQEVEFRSGNRSALLCTGLIGQDWTGLDCSARDRILVHCSQVPVHSSASMFANHISVISHMNDDKYTCTCRYKLHKWMTDDNGDDIRIIVTDTYNITKYL